MDDQEEFEDSAATAEEGLALTRLFIQLRTRADRDEAIRLLEDFVMSVRSRTQQSRT